MPLNAQVMDFDMSMFPAMRGLFASYFGSDDRLLTPQYTAWLYCQNPFGLAKAVFVKDGAQWIGFMALIPTDLLCKGKTLRTYYVVNVLVHPQWHGKNIFGKMISAAWDDIQPGGAALMGHPNAMAHKSWLRAGMHFHSPLTLRVFTPSWRHWQQPVRAVTVDNMPHALLANYRAQSLSGNQWRIDVSAAYIRWRYLDHPSHRYDVKVIGDAARPLGMTVTRQLKPCVHLLIDHFTLGSAIDNVWPALPWLTLGFVPESQAAAMGARTLASPVKKQIPFFLTTQNQTLAQASTAEIRLSASDF